MKSTFLRQRLPNCLALSCCFLASLLPQLEVEGAPRVEAYLGQPFGVGRVTIPVDRSEPSLPLSDERFTVQSADGRVLYPALKIAPIRRLLRRLLEIDTPASVTMYFLFEGDAPLELQAYSPTETQMRIVPQSDPRGHRSLLDEWWKEYSRRWRDLTQDPEFPPLVENFTTPTLARRLGKTLPPPKQRWLPWEQTKQTIWDEVFASEAYQLRVDQRLLSKTATPPAEAAALEALPSSMPWAPLEIDVAALGEVPVEPIAKHVPAESLYIRYGTFTNYLWFRDLNRQWQGDLTNMLLRRGIARVGRLRLQEQLSLKESALAKVLGPQVISDVALVVLDPYTNEGAAVGILFQAKSNFLLSRDLNGQRRLALEKYQGATETQIDFEVGAASLIASPGQEVRSYYAQDSDFHLVTNSETLARRFFEAGQNKRSLASEPGFLLARSRLPLEGNESTFIHFSSSFFQQLTSPEVWIENQRRIRSVRRLKLQQLARLMAKAEGVPAESLAQLIEAGLLPEGFAHSVDGAELLSDDLGDADSLRGRPGLFTPISDMPLEGVSAVEAEDYRRFSERFLQEVGRMPPVSVAIARTPLLEPVEGNAPAEHVGDRLTAKLLIEPRAGLKLGKLGDWVGPPSEERITATEGDLAHFELVLDTALPLLGGDAEMHHLFGGIRDFQSPLVVREGSVAPPSLPSALVLGYLGAWPKPGLLGLFTGSKPLVAPKAEELDNEMWLAGRDDFVVLSLNPDIVNEVVPQLARVPAERPAQLRFEINDLARTEVANLVSGIGYGRARETSVAASRLMNTLANQLHVPRDECRATAEQLMDGTFNCPLGGEYELVEIPGGLPMWTSSALPKKNRFMLTVLPADFELPLLSWLQSARGDALLTAEAVAAHLEVEMRDQQPEAAQPPLIEAPPPPSP